MPNEKSDLLTPSEAAAILRVTRQTIYNLVRGGTLPAVKLPGALRIPRSAIDAMVGRALMDQVAPTLPKRRTGRPRSHSS